MRQVSFKRRCTQRGSALLIVLVFAAIVAIMLYRELPVAAFEAQRQKEELLVFRGDQYSRAVKLFVRKVGRFPATIDELESTNRMRFLRRRYEDPLTGKDDWRLIHAGPGGVIIDSKVPQTNDKDKNALGQGATFKGFNNSFNGDESTPAQAVPSAALRQRPPATKNAATAGNPQDSFDLPQPQDPSIVNLDPVTGKPIPSDANGVNSSGGAGGVGAQATTGAQMANANSGLPAGNPGINTIQDQFGTTNPKTPEQSPAQQAQGQSAFGNTSNLGNTTSFGGNASTVGTGQIGGAGGIAGVASKAPGTGIKTVHDQTKYNLWEFYYDMRKDQSTALAGAQPGLQNGQANGQNQTTNGTSGSGFSTGSTIGASPTSFGASPTTFGSSPTGFGSAAPTSTTPQPQ